MAVLEAPPATPAAPSPRRVRGGGDPWYRNAPYWLLTVLLALVVCGPVIVLISGSLSASPLPGKVPFDNVTFDNYKTVYGDSLVYSVLFDTVVYTVLATVIGIAVAFALAYLVARTNLPGKWMVYAAVAMALMIPGMLDAMAAVVLFSPRIGFVNKWIDTIFHTGPGFINIYSLGGMVALEAVRVVPTAFLMLAPLISNLDVSYEEAGEMSGMSRARVIRTVTAPLLRPGLLGIVIYQALTVLSSFEIPGLLGLPGRVYVFSTVIYSYTSPSGAQGSGLPQYNVASALGIVYVLAALVGLWLYVRALRTSQSFAVVTGKGHRAKKLDLRFWRWPVAVLVGLYLLLTTVLPILTLVWTSFTPYLLTPSIEAIDRLNTESWESLFRNDLLGDVIRNTLILVVGASTLVMVLSTMISWVTVKTRFKGRRLLDQLSFIPHGVPGIVVALGMIWIVLSLPGQPGYGTIGMLIVAVSIGYIAYGVRTTSAALMQIHNDLTESAAVSGMRGGQVWRRILAPLLARSALGLWLWAALQTARSTAIPVMLQAGGSYVAGSFLWVLWNQGHTSTAAAFGVSLFVVLLVLSGLVGLLALSSRWVRARH